MVLRLKVRVGDADPDVLSECLGGLFLKIRIVLEQKAAPLTDARWRRFSKAAKICSPSRTICFVRPSSSGMHSQVFEHARAH